MHPRLRKLIGCIALIVLVVLYSMIVMTIAAAKLPGTSGWVQFAFYVAFGLLWILPAAGLVSWMSRLDRHVYH